MHKIIDGKKIASEILEDLKKEIERSQKPGLAFILVGENTASKTYVKMKKIACEKVGIRSFDFEFENITEKALIELIEKLNRDKKVDGILVQMPLPAHINPVSIINAIDPKKDVDGFHPLNMGKLLLGEEDGFLPCTPLGIKTLLQKAQIEVESKHVVIIGRSNIVGKPLAVMLMQKQQGENATVSVAHGNTRNLPEITRQADILIAAVGNPRLVTKDMVKKDAVIIDVGISREGKKIVGDVDFENVYPICSRITPVPGGVGPMTIAMLLKNTYLSLTRII
jgi:methylenetetrahydrofolate dehydrogenase (NADP+)/methenyltetrahydrofolate cyclohydrolase